MSALTSEQLNQFNQQLSAAIKANIPLPDLLKYDTKRLSKQQGEAFEKLNAQLHQGHSLADAIRNTGVASEAYACLIEAADQSGNAPAVLDQLTEMTSLWQQTQRRLMLAMIYPLFVIIFSWGMACTVFLNLAIQIERDHLDVIRSTTERFDWLMFLLQTRLYWGIGIPLGLLMLWLLLGWLLSTPRFSMSTRHTIGTMLPFSHAHNSLRESLFARLMKLLCEHKVPLSQSLPIATALYGTAAQKLSLNEAVEYLQGEQSASPGLKDWPGYLSLLKTSESSATLEEQLQITADYYRNDLQFRLFVIEVVMPRVIYLCCAVLILIPVLTFVWLPFCQHLLELSTHAMEGT